MTFGTTLHYQGYTLKSKVEFAWARFFFTEGVDWEYEPVTFRDGRTSYTPDFRIGNQYFVEIKADRGVVRNRIELCPSALLVIFGIPDRCYIRHKPAGKATMGREFIRSWAAAYGLIQRAQA